MPGPFAYGRSALELLRTPAAIWLSESVIDLTMSVKDCANTLMFAEDSFICLLNAWYASSSAGLDCSKTRPSLSSALTVFSRSPSSLAMSVNLFSMVLATRLMSS